MRTILLFVICIILTLLLIPVFLVCLVIQARKPLILIGKWTMRLGQAVLGIDIEVDGLENIDRKKPYVFMSNHLSFIDGPLLFLVIPQPVRVILKKEIFRIPIIGMAMRHVGFVPVDRKSIRGGKKSIDRATYLMRQKGYSFLIFPEGTRSRDGKLQTFKRGGFFLALNSQMPIAPVVLNGSFELMPRGTFFIRRGKVRVSFYPPVSVDKSGIDRLPELIDRVRKSIQSGPGSESSMAGFTKGCA